MKKIAYIAPEIPALSATFIYNEILGLQDRGISVVPISVHIPKAMVKNESTKVLLKTTIYLYKQGSIKFFAASICAFSANPLRYLQCLVVALSDAISVGFLNRTGIGLLYRFLAAAYVARILKKKNCYHIHANFAHIPTDIAMYAKLLSGVPFSFTSHANDLFERGWLLPKKIERSRIAVTISNFNKDYLVSIGGKSEKIHVVHCGVSSYQFHRKKDETGQPPFRIGTIGRMVDKKGFDVLLRAAEILKRKNTPFKLILAGNGPLQKNLEQLSERLDLGGVVEFIGPLEHKDIPAWLQKLDLFVLPCKQDKRGDMDGIPVVLMEAMLSGIPVISTKLSGIPELITHNSEGLLSAPGSPDDLANTILNMLENQDLQSYCVANAIHKVKSEFDSESNIHRMFELIAP